MAGSGGIFQTEAAAFERFVAGIGSAETKDLPRLADELGLRLRRYVQSCEAAGAPKVQIRPAKLALGVLADRTVRAQPSVDLTIWSALARQALFEGRDIGNQDIRDFQQIAKDQNGEFTDLTEFLRYCLQTLNRSTARPAQRAQGGLAIAAVLVILVLGVLGYVAYLEARFHRQVHDAFVAFEDDLNIGQIGQTSDVVSALSALSGDLEHVRKATELAPLRGWVKLPFANATATTDARYRATAAKLAAPLLADAIGLALATEGDGLALYDSLRAYGILSGQTDWEPTFLAGWVAGREASFELAGFADQVAILPGPVADLRPIDPVILDQARNFAADTPEAARAWLEMLRAPDVMALPPWDAEKAVPLLDQVALRRSGNPLTVPGLYTDAGWTLARDEAAGVAVQKTRSMAQTLFGRDLPRQNDTPDLVMARMQTETLAFWQDWLADLRVIPFDAPDTAIIVSGTLAQEWSPLPLLLQEVWAQVGGTDRNRPRPYQTEIAASFGPAIQYVEQGRMAEIAALFATANVALTTKEQDTARGNDALVDVAARARSIRSLRAAPQVVALLVEDTLAQISSGGQSVDNPLVRGWISVHAQCQRQVAGQYPIAAGADLPMSGAASLFGPSGAIPLFFKQFAAPNLEMGDSPWRWKTEARFTGLSPESAEFFEQAMAIHEGLFGSETYVDVTALAERGQATLSLGGADAAVRANAVPVRMTWPGPRPQNGIALRFQGAEASETLSRAGVWGLLRLLDDLRVRPRDDGQRFLVDMRDDTGRLFLEMNFEDAINPVSVRPLLQDFTCPERL